MTPSSGRARVMSLATTDRGPYAVSRRGRGPQWRLLLGIFTVTASLLYFVSDLIEALQGGFSERRNWVGLKEYMESGGR